MPCMFSASPEPEPTVTDRESLISSLVIRLDRLNVAAVNDRAFLAVLADQMQAPDLLAIQDRIWDGGQASSYQWNRLVGDVIRGIQQRRLEAVWLARQGAKVVA